MARLGSFAASVNLPEAMRPWAHSGLEHLLVPGGLPAHPAAEGPAPHAQAVHPQPFSAPTPAAPASAPIPHDAPRWPEPWKSLAARVKGTPRVIITYTELAVDLSGTPHPGRRKLFRDILAYAAWPQGTALFWPLCSLKDGKPLYSPTVFSAGVRHFDIRTILCFGGEAYDMCQGILPQTNDQDKITVERLPHPSELVDALPHEMQIAVQAIKRFNFTP